MSVGSSASEKTKILYEMAERIRSHSAFSIGSLSSYLVEYKFDKPTYDQTKNKAKCILCKELKKCFIIPHWSPDFPNRKKHICLECVNRIILPEIPEIGRSVDPLCSMYEIIEGVIKMRKRSEAK